MNVLHQSTQGWPKFLLTIVCLAEVAKSCFHNCCCTNGETQISCDGTELLPLPPYPTNISRWCGGDRGSVPDGSKVVDIRLEKTKADHIDIAGLSKYPNVQKVSVAYSNFQILPQRSFYFPGAPSRIEEIDAKHNKISQLSERAFEGLPQLKRIFLTGNRIRIVPIGLFSDTPKIQEVWLNENEIRKLDPSIFYELYSLDKIELSSNLIEELDTFPKILITSLKLGNNSLTTLRSDVFDNLRMLQVLDLKMNKLTTIPENLFSENYELRLIYLNNNNLKSIGKDTFSHLCALRSLDLRSNQLKVIHLEWFASIAYNSAEKMGVSDGSGQPIRDYPVNGGNQWSCAADDKDFMEYALFLTATCNYPRLKEINLVKYLNLRCSSGRMLIDSETCESKLPKEFNDNEKEAILSQNSNSQKCNDTEIPPCHFIPPQCAGLPQRSFSPDISPDFSPKMIIVYAGIAILLMVVTMFVARRVVRNRREKRRRRYPSDASSEDSEYESESPITLQPSPEQRPQDENLLPSNPRKQEVGNRPHPHLPNDPTRPSYHEAGNSPQPIPPELSRRIVVNHCSWIESFQPDSFGYLDYDRRGPEGASGPNSSAQSTTSEDAESIGTSCSVTVPKEVETSSPVTLGSESSITQPKAPIEIRSPRETAPKELVSVRSETVPKAVQNLGERKTNLQQAQNTYVQTPKREQLDNTEYTPMAPQTNPVHPPSISPLIPDRSGVPVVVPAPPSSECSSCHWYCSVIDPITKGNQPILSIPYHRPFLPPPHHCPNPDCRLYYPQNPVFLPQVVYRERGPPHARPRSDQQPLLGADVETSPGDVFGEEKKVKKNKKKKKKGAKK